MNEFGDQNRNVLENLNLPDTFVVASGSKIKIDAVQKAVQELFPNKTSIVVGVKNAQSEINEQPVGDETQLGAFNRLKNATAEVTTEKPDLTFTGVSIENGIFPEINSQTGQPTGEWHDKAVVVIKLPNGQTVIQESVGVRFPKEIVEETRLKGGPDEGFKKYTVGSVLAEKGIVQNKQDPHAELTNGVITREIQMVDTIKQAFIALANPQKS